MMHELWKNDTWLTDQSMITNTSIIEYDMKSANTSLAREFNLLPTDFIDKLESLSKKEREIKVGLYKTKHKDYNDKERAAFMQARKLFFEQNKLEDSQIVSIKKDAIFVEGNVTHTQITKHINFRKKHEYTSFLFLSPVEIYYAPTGLDIKKINTDVYTEYHKEYFGKFLFGVLHGLEVMQKKDVIRYIRDFYDRYKNKKLEVEYYREFNPRSMYHMEDGFTNGCWDIDELDISYNAKLIIDILLMLM